MNTKIIKINKIDNACKKYKQVHKSNNIKFNKLDQWLDKESDIFIKETNNTKNATYKKLKRGQLIKVDFGINIGSELCHTHFAIVINKIDSIYSDNITIVPITSKPGKSRINIGKVLHLIYPNSSKYNLDCYINVSQIKTISKTRIFQNNKNYICDNNILNKIDNEIIKMFINI